MMFNKRESIEAAEAGLEDALKNFRSSVHAWSDAEFTRPRSVLLAEHRRTWRRAAAWALGCALAASTLSAGIYEHHLHDQSARLARIAAEHAAQNKQFAAQQNAAQDGDFEQEAAGTAAQAPAQPQGADEKLMAAVDQDVSQPVPSALEPLAQLMDEAANQ